MHRIDSEGTAVALPTPGAVGATVGYFTESNPSTGVKATVVSADWLNAIQEEICYVIEQSGLALDKTSRTQLKEAIARLGGDSGGQFIQWHESDNSPLTIYENNLRSSAFMKVASDADAQYLTASVRVPSSYTAGTQISLRFPFYSPDSSGTVKWELLTYLVRSGTDLISSTTNSNSHSASTTLSGATANIPQAISRNLTNGSGQVNGVAVAPGDLLIMKLSRLADTATSDAKVITDAMEVKFSL